MNRSPCPKVPRSFCCRLARSSGPERPLAGLALVARRLAHGDRDDEHRHDGDAADEQEEEPGSK
jgi:hypothetical protein